MKRKIDNESMALEYCVGVGNQHAKMTRRGDGDLTTSNSELVKTVDVKSNEKAGEAHVKMRNSERSKALAKQYNLHRERDRKVLFGWKDLLNATIGMCVLCVNDCMFTELAFVVNIIHMIHVCNHQSC